jgi:hypothetical protein
VAVAEEWVGVVERYVGPSRLDRAHRPWQVERQPAAGGVATGKHVEQRFVLHPEVTSRVAACAAMSVRIAGRSRYTSTMDGTPLVTARIRASSSGGYVREPAW